ncbi:hypothetical protein COK00_06250 [Bacillus cereus]|uniref:Uncharacterized protein n=1 Tax=Bacillus cereus TaxID=1396 RepID=A0A2C2FIJ5_BACCE|nr:hypothetical protein CON28_03050 [Bacillus cereus]PEQ50610.1 hypothetical protein CN468_10375 [Bacillus cereus]PEX38302.1 hypothetical protein CN455_13310 [Bacillus cereus]PFB17729.1 hypothetical protein CN399_06585 [Bacillus cereus]PFB60704.1 hypothetical protein CN291_24650 [Bacillus cereus]
MPHSKYTPLSLNVYFFYHITKLSLLEKEKAEMIIFHLYLFTIILI